MAEPQLITPGMNRVYVPIMINGDRTNYGLDFENSIPVDSTILCGLPVDLNLEAKYPYDPDKKIKESSDLLNTQTKISLLEIALKHFAGRGMDFLLVDPLTCQTIIMGKDCEEESLEYKSNAFVRAAPMVRKV